MSRRLNGKNALRTAVYLVLLFFLIGYIVLPLFNTIGESLLIDGKYTFKEYVDYFTNENQMVALKNTVVLGILSVVSCGIVGTLLAYCLTFYRFRGQKIIHIILLSPLMIPGVITVITFNQIYGESGIVNKAIQLLLNLKEVPINFQGLPAILFVIAYTQYVYFYMNIHIAMKYIDQSQIDAARSMGAGDLRIFRQIIWPVIRPAFLSSMIISFASGISSFSAPNLIGGGYKVLSTQIVKAKSLYNMSLASVQVVVLLVLSVTVMMLIRYYENKYRSHMAVRPVPVKKRELTGIKGAFIWLILTIQVVLVVLPVIAMVYLSFMTTTSIMREIFPTAFTFENYTEIFTDRRAVKPMINSLKMALIAVGLSFIVAVPGSYLVARGKEKMRNVLRLLIMLPWCMPGSVIGINMINSFNKGNLFAFGASLIGGFMILPIGYAIYSLPLMFTSSEVALNSIDPNLEAASRSLGAGTLRTMFRVVLPNIAPGILSGGVLVFIRSMGEYTLSALLYGVHNRPISISVVTNMQEYFIGLSFAYGVVTILICYIALFIIFKVDEKRFSL
ncbi:MAG: iron ABC transporter permease [Clostridia bacterium]|nr:iron ABC transporter permease [Clostridia bacterium]